MEGDDLDLHEELGTCQVSLDCRTSREVGSERGPVDFVHLLEPTDVREEHSGLHDVLQAASSLRQLDLDVREGILGLRLESRRRDAGLRVRTDLPRDDAERPRY